ncbi:hypothetical protein A4G19_06675 [Pasteurellaceae bacterium Macca]|nr:hypothetical protein [Pasteurellaceae bacterium Macca]
MIIKKPISKTELHILFYQISEKLGFTADVVNSYQDDLDGLMRLWEEQGFVEVYEFKWERRYGRAKNSDRIPPAYMGLYHARLVIDDNDPLLVLKFENEDTDEPVLSIRFMADHDDLFGSVQQKHYPEILRAIRNRIAEFIKLGDNNK